MAHSFPTRRSSDLVATVAVSTLAFTTLSAASATTATSSAVASEQFPVRFELPAGFQPEGIAISGTTAYFGQRATGDIYAADLRTGEGSVISQGPGTGSNGLKVDPRGRLFVAGAAGGDGRVIDTRTGKVLAG